MKVMFILWAASVFHLAAQTQIDLHSQIKKATAPVKSGSTFPASCQIGDLFVKTDAPFGSNIFACVATNTWIQQIGGGAGGTASLTVQSDGTVVGSRPVQNLIAGTGILKAISDSGTRIDIVDMVDTAVIQTRSNAQSGKDVLCESRGGSGAVYTCSLSAMLVAYSDSMVLHWKPDVNGNGGSTTLAINGLAAVPVKLADGVSNPLPGDIPAGQLTSIWFDGAVFRLLNVPLIPLAARPVCDSSARGRLWYTRSLTSTKDELSLCAKDASDQFAWRVVY